MLFLERTLYLFNLWYQNEYEINILSHCAWEFGHLYYENIADLHSRFSCFFLINTVIFDEIKR